MQGICPREPRGFFRRSEEGSIAFWFDSLERPQKTEAAHFCTPDMTQGLWG